MESVHVTRLVSGYYFKTSLLRVCCSCFCACLFKSILGVSECNWFHDNFLNQWLKFIHHNLAIKHFTAGRLLAWLHAPELPGVLLFSLRALSYPESIVREKPEMHDKIIRKSRHNNYN